MVENWKSRWPQHNFILYCLAYGALNYWHKETINQLEDMGLNEKQIKSFVKETQKGLASSIFNTQQHLYSQGCIGA